MYLAPNLKHINMKKIILLFSIAGTILISSCSKSDDNDSPPPSILLKSFVQTDADGSVITSNITYNGNKWVKTVNVEGTETSEQRYTYTGDLITKIEEYSGTTGGILIPTSTNIYEYNANEQLVVLRTILEGDTRRYFRRQYSYNPAGTITAYYYTGNATTQDQLLSTTTIIFTNGEVSRTEEASTGFPAVISTYTYDDKNNPDKNITGVSKIAFMFEDDPGIGRNLAEKVVSEVGLPLNNITTRFQYTYNGDNYPVTSRETEIRGDASPIIRYNTTYSY